VCNAGRSRFVWTVRGCLSPIYGWIALMPVGAFNVAAMATVFVCSCWLLAFGLVSLSGRSDVYGMYYCIQDGHNGVSVEDALAYR